MAASVLEWTLIANDRASDKFDRVGRHADGVGAKFAKFGRIAAAALAVATIAAIKFGADSIAAASDAEKAQNRLQIAWEKSARTADVSLTSIRALNTELQKTTKYDDDLIASAQGVLVNFKLTGSQIRELTPLMLDYASRTGKDLPTAATDLGKALLGQGRALKNIGVNFKDTGSVTGNYTELIAALQGQVGGFAKGEATTLAGKLAILKNRFGEIQEKVGGALVGPLTTVADIVDQTLMPAFEKFAGWLGDKIPAAFAIVAPYLPQIAAGFVKIFSALAEDGTLDALGQLVVDILPPLTDLLIALAPAIPPIASAISTLLVPAIQVVSQYLTGLNAAWSGNIDQQRAWLRQIVALSGPVGAVARGILNAFVGAFNGVVDGANAVTTAIELVVNSLSWLTGIHIDLPKLRHLNVSTMLLGSSTPMAQKSPGRVGGVNAGMFADGGIITKPTLALMGEAGEPEGVFPLSKAGQFGFGASGGGVSVTFTGPVYGASAADLARQVTDSLVRGISSGQLSAAPLRAALGI